MSFWVHALCKESVADVTPEALRVGIGERLALLTYLFCPEHEEDPAVVMKRLRIEDRSEAPGTFGTFLIHHREDGVFMNVTRSGREHLDELCEQVLPSLGKVPGLDVVRPMLAAAREDVSFDLKASDVAAMGFPIAIAAAATLVARAGGVIQSGSWSWMVPAGREVRILCEVEGE